MCEWPWGSQPPLLTRSHLGPAGGCASQEQCMQNALGGYSAPKPFRSLPGWIDSQGRSPSIPETGSGEPAPTRRPAAPSSGSCGHHVAVCVPARLQEAEQGPWLNAARRTQPCSVTLNSPFTASFVYTAPVCTRTHIHTFTQVDVQPTRDR